MGYWRPEEAEEAGTERDGEGSTAWCASFRPTRFARAARPRAARGRRQAAVSTSKNRAARPRPNFAAAPERGAGAAQDGEGTAGCARYRLASLPHAARPHALPVGRDRPSTPQIGRCQLGWDLRTRVMGTGCVVVALGAIQVAEDREYRGFPDGP